MSCFPIHRAIPAEACRRATTALIKTPCCRNHNIEAYKHTVDVACLQDRGGGCGRSSGHKA